MTAQRAMLVNSCYVLRAMEVRNVSNSKSDLLGHSGTLAMVLFDRSHTISISIPLQLCLSCTVNEIISLISQNVKRSRDFEHIPFGVIYHACTSTLFCQSAHDI